MENLALLIAIFLAGFVVGAIVCFLVMAQIYKHKRVKDELLKTKRAAIKSQRTLDRFLKTSLDLFSQLDEVHKQYVDFLSQTAQKIAPEEADLHSFLTQSTHIQRRDDKKKKQPKDIAVVTGTLGEIATPKELQSPTIPEDAIPQELINNEHTTQEPNPIIKNEEVEEEKLKV